MMQYTSVEAYHSIKNSGLLSDKRMKVYEIFFENPNGLTGTQVSEIFKSKYPSSKHSETIRNRITELRDVGCIRELGIVQCETSKRNVMRFIITNNLPIRLDKKTTLKEKLDDVLNSIEVLGVLLTNEIEKEKLREIYKKIKSIKK